jgi:hypothetical protein
MVTALERLSHRAATILSESHVVIQARKKVRQRGVSVKVAKSPKQFPCCLSSVLNQAISSSQLYSAQTEHSQFAATRAIFQLSGITGWIRMLLPGCAC